MRVINACLSDGEQFLTPSINESTNTSRDCLQSPTCQDKSHPWPQLLPVADNHECDPEDFLVSAVGLMHDCGMNPSRICVLFACALVMAVLSHTAEGQPVFNVKDYGA